MKVCFLATYYSKDYIRQSVMLGALKKSGHEVIECVENGGSLLRYPKVILRFLEKRKGCDVVVVGYRGQEIMPIVRLLTKKKIVFDAFLSFYNRACFDRKIFSPNSLPGRALFLLDRASCTMADRVLLDTDAHIDYFSGTFGIGREKFGRVFIGADSEMFFPRKKTGGNKKFTVLWYGSFIPLQGAEYIIEAAKILRAEKDIEFLLAGNGPLYKKITGLAESGGLDNVKFAGAVPHGKIPEYIAEADVCLGGHFRGNVSAKTVIAGKAFEMIAMRKAVILGDSPAVRELFSGKGDVVMCEMENPASLAQAIMKIKNDKALKRALENNSYKIYMDKCTPDALGKTLGKILEAE